MKTNGTLQELKEYASARRKRKKWLTAVTCLAGIVVFCTVYALILPAIALERDAQCGLEEHQHTDDCYESTYVYPQAVMKCSLESLGIHTHTEECRNEEGTLVCGYADFVIHTHDSYCYSEDGTLICTLPEIEAHTHGNECYDENGTLICGKTEIIAHTHTADCRDAEGNLICGQTEIQVHQHTGDCIQVPEGEAQEVRTLICGLDEHTHTDACRMTEEEAAQVNEVINQIDALPSGEMIGEALENFENTGDDEGKEAYLTALIQQIQKAYTAYSALNADLQECVTNRDKLMELETFWNTMYLNGEEDENTADEITVTVTVDGTEYKAIAEQVTDTEGGLKKSVEAYAAVLSGDAGYTVSDVGFYKITGLQDNEGNEIPLDSVSGVASVSVAYTDGSCLAGSAGNRKLLVLDLGEDGNAVLSQDNELFVSGGVTKETADQTAGYYSFTYETSNLSNVVAFTSLNLLEGYVKGLSVTKITDGSAPWDVGSDAGNDGSESNKIVRTFDTIAYDLEASFLSRTSDKNLTTATLGFEMTMEKNLTEAEFDIEFMSWLGDTWEIEYLDKEGNVVLIKDPTGLYRVTDGVKAKKTTTINSLICGSDQEEGSYNDTLGIVTQRLTGTYTVTKTNGDTVVPGTQTLYAGIQVLASKHGDTFQPSFRVWLVGNEDNFGPEDNDSSGQLGAGAYDRVTVNELTGDAVSTVIVSAAARYNIALVKNSLSYRSWFDFTTGKEAVANEDGSYPETAAYGRMLNYGIMVQLYNDTDSTDSSVLASKGLKGVELPVGDITFDLSLTSSIAFVDEDGNPITDTEELAELQAALNMNDYTPLLWEHSENVNVYTLGSNGLGKYTGRPQGTGVWLRNMYWNNETRTQYAKDAVPYNQKTGGSSTGSCYSGGSWQVPGYTVDGTDQSEAPTLNSATGDGSGTVYHFKVSGYTFDFDNFDTQWPITTAGNSGQVSWYNTYSGSFSAGYIQVLQRFPKVPAATTTISLKAEIDNLKMASLSNPNPTEVTECGNGTKDNISTGTITIYTPGSMSKGNTFTGRNSTSYSVDFLGTWNEVYDCSTYAGNKIFVYGYGFLSYASDGRIKAMNLLQKFDSKVLSIDRSYTNGPEYLPGYTKTQTNEELYGTYGNGTFLYAADPLYPGGWDTNAVSDYSDDEGRLVGGMMGSNGKMPTTSRMNTAAEEDLIYFTSLDALEEAGYTCIGVLMEVRECDLMGGLYVQLRIPMIVSDASGNIGNTVCTINSVKAWVAPRETAYDGMTNITWENGKYNDNPEGGSSGSIFKNICPGLAEQQKSDGEITYFSVVNKPSSGYVKTEYDKTTGQQITGTDMGGRLYGSSLLILGYTSSVSIKVANNLSDPPKESTSATGNISFDTGNSEWNADYTITGIRTTASAVNTSDADTRTNLTIQASIDEGLTMQPGSYQMNSLVLDGDGSVKTDDNGNPLTETVVISTDADAPTSVTFQDADNKKIYTINIYAVESPDGQMVTFQLSEVPVGYSLPDIAFTAVIDSTAKNNDTFNAKVTISGDGDNRSFDEDTNHGNMATVGIKIVALNGTSLSKSVNKSLVELDDTFTYELKYTNTGNDVMSDTLYLYDISPYNGDIRSSTYNGEVDITSISAKLVKEDGSDDSEFSAQVRFYYSMVPGEQLKNIIDFANLPDPSGLYLRQLLSNAVVDADGNVYFFKNGDGSNVDLYTYDANGKITGRNFKVDANGYISSVSYKDFIKVSNIVYENGEIKIDGTTGNYSNGTYTKLFRYLGDLTSDDHEAITDSNNSSSSDFSHATCVFAVARNLGAQKSICIDINVKTDDNVAADLYGNMAHSWISGSATDHTLISNQVYTRVLSRAISGVVWYDSNLDGVRDDNEALLSGVTAALFKLDENKESDTYGKYVPCTAGVTDKGICTGIGQDGQRAYTEDGTTVTDSDGNYYFGDLSAGNYIVAFSKDDLKQYTGAAIYQVNKENDDNTNDGVPLLTTSGSLDTEGITFNGIDSNKYAYAIAYSLSGKNPEAVSMHSIEEITAPNSGIVLNNYVELYANQDLGLVIAGFELPKTGGTGTILFTIGGLLLMAGAVGCGYGLRRRRERRANG